jgi:hypothetical protein
VGIDPFQANVAKIALAAATARGFALAGGNALVAHDVVQRATQDVDLFSPEPGAPGAVADQVRRLLEAGGYHVEIIRRPEDSAGEFAQLAVSRGEQTVLLDLARDWRLHPPVSFDIGPVLHIDDAVGSKVTALVSRGLPRDFIDVAAALERYSRGQLMTMAFLRDPGLRVVDFTDAARALDRIPAAAFAAYGLDAAAVSTLRARFAEWPRAVSADRAAYRVHEGHRSPGAMTPPGNPPGSRSAARPRALELNDDRPESPSL